MWWPSEKLLGSYASKLRVACLLWQCSLRAQHRLAARHCYRSILMAHETMQAGASCMNHPIDTCHVIGTTSRSSQFVLHQFVHKVQDQGDVCRCFNCKYSKAASLAENLAFLREVLQELGRGHKVVVFVLDEFDLFAKKPKQTTLYNLLDAMQSAGMQVGHQRSAI